MTHANANPAARAGADRAWDINGVMAFDAPDHTADDWLPQAIIARPYRLDPVMARLICRLAGIGGRA